MRYVSLDLETTGLEPGINRVIEMAMVLEDTSKRTPVKDLPFFRCYVKHKAAYWDAYCLKLHRHAPAMAAQNIEALPGLTEEGDFGSLDGVPIYSWDLATTRAIDWLASHGFTREKGKQATPAGKNFGAFDRLFLDEELRSVFNRRALDPGSLLVDWSKTELQSLAELLGREPAHNALDDARDVITVLRRAYK